MANDFWQRYLPAIHAFEDKSDLYDDKFQTPEQKDRDENISRLLECYVNSFERKKIENIKSRKEIKWFCFLSSLLLIITIFSILAITIIFDVDSLYSVAVILSAMFGLFGTIFGIIKYVARFAFPEEDEKYITEIVKSIQENDLKDKQENIKVSFMKK